MLEEKRQKEQLRKDCFDARNKLIVKSVTDKRCITEEKIAENRVGCIKLNFRLGMGMINPWNFGVNPEKAYRAVEPSVSYCTNFWPDNPLGGRCNCESCPMYEKYSRYIKACMALQALEKKTR